MDHKHTHETEMQHAEEGGMRGGGDGAAENGQYFRGNPSSAPMNGYATNGHANGYTNGTTNGFSNGNGYVSHTAEGYPKPAEPTPIASRNF
jgi:hypothetical protein